MSGNDQDMAIVRLVKQRSEAKKQKAAIENELRTAGQFLYSIGVALKSVKTDGPHLNSPSYILPEIEKAPDICALQKIEAMLIELQELHDRLYELNQSAVAMGID